MNRPLRVALVTGAVGFVALAISQDFPLCPLASSFGIPCPGCGLTRATLALLRGDVRAALHLHPLVWLLTPLFSSFVGGAIWQFLRDPRAPRRTSRLRWNSTAVNVAAVLLLVLTLGVWLLRFAGYFGGPAPVTSLYTWLNVKR